MLGSSNHVASVHEGLKPLKCESCDYSSFLKHNMKTDVSSVHEGNKSFKCGICDYRFSQTSDFRCSTCPQVFGCCEFSHVIF